MGKMMMRLLLAVACLVFFGLSAAEAKQCSNAFYRDVVARSIAIEKNGAACRKALRWRAGVAEICSKCRATVKRLSALESILRRNKSCFQGRARRDVEQLMSIRDELRFMRRGCG